jgi:hypothetical protein
MANLQTSQETLKELEKLYNDHQGNYYLNVEKQKIMDLIVSIHIGRKEQEGLRLDITKEQA